MAASTTRSRVGFATLLVVLFGLSGGGAYLFRKRQLDRVEGTVAVVPDETTIAETTVAPTTEALVIDSTVPTETTAGASTTEAPPQTTVAPTTEAAPQPRSLALTTDGASLSSANGASFWDDAAGCDSIAQTGSAEACDRIQGLGGVNIAWVRERNSGVTILQNDPGVDLEGQWNVQLRGDTSTRRGPLVTDVTGDGQPELVFGYRNGDDLGVDVVEIREGSAGVALHLELPGGRLSAGNGSMEVWQSGDRGAEHWTIERTGGRWTKSGFSVTDSPPDGDL